MKRLGVIANHGKVRASEVLETLGPRAVELGLEILAEQETAALLPGSRTVDRAGLLDGAEAVLALGGDGTMLHAVRDLDGRDIPVIGVNVGGLGFLTSAAADELGHALECIAKDDFTVMAMAVAEASVDAGEDGTRTYRAVNDVVFSRDPSSGILGLDVSVDGEYVASYACDGLIVSTPAGSTGHSLSAGGPILSPSTQAFVISQICAHTLSTRPVVVPDGSRIRVCAPDPERPVLLSIDGETVESVGKETPVVVTRSAKDVGFIRLPGHSYFGVLRQKLRWSG
ncbi:MAG: NAD(+)/NADH kinase, partial [Lentisphaerae bacterium]|nr:NAD(+)/NADH kinase [Lentisphaerota bacterium]